MRRPRTAEDTTTTDAGGIAGPHLEPSADISAFAEIGPRATVWHLAQVREYARIGTGCVLGRGAYVGRGVILGINCKVENYALIYEAALVEDGVFIGPAVVLTNDQHPRAVNVDGSLKTDADWTMVGVTVRTGASIGARAVCVAPLTIGRWAMIAAGAVVTRNVPDYALVAGAPALQVGWVGRSGVRLVDNGDGTFTCPVTNESYHQIGERLDLT